ncbi:MAG: BON domain-containing protein [Rhodospirillales bacterium]|nr:BON domain-containing protein [Rhodospirillales bacterium]
MMNLSKPMTAVLLLTLLAPLSGCVSMVIGAGATVGVAAMEERPLKVHLRDTTIATEIRYNLVEASEKFITGVGIEVYEGKALITGVVENEAMRAQALKLVWKVEGLKDVYNELQVGDNGITNFAKDSWVTTQLKSKTTFDQDVLAINYKIETVNGVVYLIGIAQSKREIDKVIAHARSLGYVKRVISHVRIKKVAS